VKLVPIYRFSEAKFHLENSRNSTVFSYFFWKHSENYYPFSWHTKAHLEAFKWINGQNFSWEIWNKS